MFDETTGGVSKTLSSQPQSGRKSHVFFDQAVFAENFGNIDNSLCDMGLLLNLITQQMRDGILQLIHQDDVKKCCDILS